MRKKNLVSMSVAAIFGVLGTTGLLLYLKQKPHSVEMTHTIFGLLFITLAIFHIVNNWGSLRAYTSNKEQGGLRKEFWVVAIAAITMVTLAATEVLEPVAEFGRIFAKPAKKGPAGITFQEYQTLDSASGKPVTLLIQKSPEMLKAKFTVTLADSSGKMVSSLFESGEGSEEGQPSHLLLHTKIAAEGPFQITIRSVYEGTEGISQTNLSSLATGAAVLATGEGTGLVRALLEVR